MPTINKYKASSYFQLTAFLVGATYVFKSFRTGFNSLTTDLLDYYRIKGRFHNSRLFKKCLFHYSVKKYA